MADHCDKVGCEECRKVLVTDLPKKNSWAQDGALPTRAGSSTTTDTTKAQEGRTSESANQVCFFHWSIEETHEI